MDKTANYSSGTNLNLKQDFRQMETLIKELDRGLLKELECPICLEYMSPPITLCKNGHNICNNCKPKLNHCPTCRKQIMHIRNLSLETLSRQTSYPCLYKKAGCPVSYTLDRLGEHQMECTFGKHQCPFAKISKKDCPWTGLISEIRNHVKNDHSKPYYREEISKFKVHLKDIASTKSYSQAIFVLNELFYTVWRFGGGHFYCAVFYCGPKENTENYRYRLIIEKSKGKECISYCFCVHSFMDDVQEILKPNKCVCLVKETVDNFKDETNSLICEMEIMK